MYYYIYDNFVQDKDHAKELAAVENRLADFGITGNIGRLSLFRDAHELIHDEVKRGAKTVVAVGNDGTLKKVLEAVIATRVMLGFIPLAEPCIFAKLFGIPLGVAAVDVLARRTFLTVDVGKVNGRVFLSRLHIPEGRCAISCEGRFRVETRSVGSVQIKNTGWIEGEEAPEVGNPHDGYLEAVIDAKEERGFFRKPVWRRSQLVIKKAVIEAPGTTPIAAFVDEEKYAQQRFEISILPKRLRIIVGKERMV